ncbi:unnamed protein product [Moneuplotes crassus]|uniref:Uncharacterized protein n=1 Tax=Euplotes crassus TaxID=5936 RepID=A0AAD2D381_EUPCR|nr:unnamed protein product [Moneuplotes crassus]
MEETVREKAGSRQGKYPNIEQMPDLKDFLTKIKLNFQLPGLKKEKPISISKNHPYLAVLSPVMNGRNSRRTNRSKRRKPRLNPHHSLCPRPITGVSTYYRATDGNKNNFIMKRAKNLLKKNKLLGQKELTSFNESCNPFSPVSGMDSNMVSFTKSFLLNGDYSKRSTSPTHKGKVRFFTRPQKAKEFEEEFKKQFLKYKLNENKMVKKLNIRYKRKDKVAPRVVLNKSVL